MLDPQARALLKLIEERGLPPMHTLSPAEARRFYLERRFFTQPEAPDVAAVSDLEAEGPAGTIPLRSYRPLGSQPDAALPVLVYFHGGGWTIGDLDTHDVLCRQLANGAGCAVVAVDYRMGPENRFPAAVDDCFAALRWVHAQAANLKLDARRIAVGGDSAGGNLAAVVSILARDAGAPNVDFQLLIYPATDQRRGAPSHTENAYGYLLEKPTMDYYVGNYIDDAKHHLDWRASPLLHPDLKGLPRAFVLTAGYDPLRDEGLEYAQKLSEAGVPCSLVSFPRQIHGFITMGKVIDEANTAVQLCASQLRSAFARA
jgi:acetyl esterase